MQMEKDLAEKNSVEGYLTILGLLLLYPPSKLPRASYNSVFYDCLLMERSAFVNGVTVSLPLPAAFK